MTVMIQAEVLWVSQPKRPQLDS